MWFVCSSVLMWFVCSSEFLLWFVCSLVAIARFGEPMSAVPFCLAVQPSKTASPLLGHVPLPIASKLQATAFQTGSSVSLLTMLLGNAKSNSWLSETESWVVRLRMLTTRRESVSVWGAASPCKAKTKGASFLTSLKLFLVEACVQKHKISDWVLVAT